jgi:hypothetical protein
MRSIGSGSTSVVMRLPLGQCRSVRGSAALVESSVVQGLTGLRKTCDQSQ